jgi:hypothetical protein
MSKQIEKGGEIMKKFFLTMLLIFGISSFAFSGSPLWQNILKDSHKVTISGTVSSLPLWGNNSKKSLEIKTEKGVLKIFGIGPARYWFLKKVSTPYLGENITVTAFKLNINSKTYFIAEKITNAKGETIILRDSTTAMPLWKANIRKARYMQNKFCYGN